MFEGAFKEIVGNEPIKAYLLKAFRENHLPQTLLFSGLSGIGKSLFAKTVAAALLETNLSRIEGGNHPDFHWVRPEGKSGIYSIDTVRSLIDTDRAAPFESTHKVFLLEDAERMQIAGANALLKTLEEPSPDTTFILISSNPQEMLPTILSRCVHLSFQPVPKDKIEEFLVKKGLSSHLANRSHGSIGGALELGQKTDAEEIQKILFRILPRRGQYLEVSKDLNELERRIEEEEDPVLQSRRVEHLLALILMWARDQNLMAVNGPKELLFFPEEPAAESAPPLKEIEKAIDEARLGIQRNLSLLTCLGRVLYSS